MKNPLWLAVILVVALSFVTSAQQQQPPLKSSVSANAEAPTKLLLEIVFNPELPPFISAKPAGAPCRQAHIKV
jgi:hypothetical protein